MGKLIGGGGGASAAAAQEQLKQSQAETEKLRQQTEEEKRTLSEQIASKRLARARGGSRLLLSESRLNPEEGLTPSDTLGA
jgi:hypothetical protein